MASFWSGLFGGGNEREAANQNRASTQQYSNNSLGAYASGFGNSANAYQNYGQNARNNYQNSYNLYGNMRNAGQGYINSGEQNSLSALNNASNSYAPLEELAKKYGVATTTLLNSLGVNGASGNEAAQQAFHEGPGYQYATNQATQAVERSRAKRGMYNSGNLDLDTNNAVQGLANQEYGNWQNKLSGFLPYESGATSAAASGRAGINSQIAQLYQNTANQRLGLENAATSGQAGANAGGAQNEQWMGGNLANLYSQNAQNQVGVYGNVNNQNQASNNQEAAGRSQGQRNLLNAGMGLASLAAGAATGGMGGGSFGSLFGGGSSMFGNGTGGNGSNPWMTGSSRYQQSNSYE